MPRWMAVITGRVRWRERSRGRRGWRQKTRNEGRGEEIRKGSEKSLARRGVNESDERGEWTENMCQCVHVCQLNNKHTAIYLWRTKRLRLALKLITSPVLCVRQLMLLPSLAHGHTKTRFFKGLTAGLFTQRKIGSLNLLQFKHELT